MAGLADLLEAYRNYRGTQNWRLGRQMEQMHPQAEQAMELWGGMGPSDIGGLAGTFVGVGGAKNLGKSEQVKKGLAMLHEGRNPATVWQETLTMKHPTTGETLLGISDAPALYKGPQAHLDYLKKAQEKLDYLKQHQAKYPQDNLEVEIRAAESRINDAMEGYFSGTLTDFLEHPELMKAYPGANLVNIEVSPGLDSLGEYRGYRQSMPEIGLREDIAMNRYMDPDTSGLSTLLHELTHYGSHMEGRPSGGSPEVMDAYRLRELQGQEAAPFAAGRNVYEDLWKKTSYNEALARALKYREFTKRDNIKPSAITSLMDWYKYSDDIRSKLGAMPKRAGSQRDAWMRNAFGILAKDAHIEGINKYGAMFDQELETKSLRDLLNEERRLDRQRAKVLPDFKEARAIESKYRRLGEMTPFERYQRIADEALARQVQTMAPMTEIEMRQHYPMANDELGGVPVNDLVNIWRAGRVTR